MKRSEINQLLRWGKAFLDEHHFKLPPFADWTPAEWATKGEECAEIRDNMLGWDVTDFGGGGFDKMGLLLFTIRNGNATNPNYVKPYAEKLLIVQEEQITPMHFHWHKMEDIINRGGGNLMVKLYNSDESEDLANTPVSVSIDGQAHTVEAGGVVRLTPGESITLAPRLYHEFWGEQGAGTALIGEVSMTNDDRNDNRFHQPLGRFPSIEEDEPPLRLLCTEYTQ